MGLLSRCVSQAVSRKLFIARSDAHEECWWPWAGAEREEGFIILMSRMERAAVGPVLRNLGDASFQRVVRRVGPGPFFDPSNPAGQYLLRLDRRGDRRVLAQLFELAAKASKDKDRRDDKNLAPGIEEITQVGLQGLWAASPIAAAEVARAMHAKALSALATANERRFKENLNGDYPDPRPPGPEPPPAGAEGDGKRMLEYLDEVLLHSDPTRVAAAPFAPVASASHQEARETRLGVSKSGDFANATALLQSAPKMRAGEKLPDDKSGSAALLAPDHRIGLTLPSSVLQALCKRGRHVNVAHLRHWAGADGQGGGEGERDQEKGSGDTGQEDAASLVLEAPSRVTQEQRIAIEQEIALRGEERRKRDALGPNLAMRQEGALASVLIWFSCIPLPPPLPSPASPAMEPQEFIVVDASDPQLGLEKMGLEGGEGRSVGRSDATTGSAAQQRAGALRLSSRMSCNSSSDSSDDVGEAEMLGHDADVQDDAFGLGDALVRDVPPYMQLNRDPLAARYPTTDEIDGWRQQVMNRWLPRPIWWEELQERPYKQLRSYHGKAKFVGAPLAVELKATDVLRVVFNTFVDSRLTQVLKRVRGNVQTGLRAAVLRELSGDGFSHEDYRASFLYRMLSNLPPPAPPPPGDNSHTCKPPKPKAPVGRNAKQQAAAKLLQERRRGVQCIDIAAPREASLIDDIPATPPNKWERKLFLISEIFGAAEAAAVTASWRGGGGMREKKSRSFSSLDMLSEGPEAALEAGNSARSPSNVTPEELEAEQRLKETEEREQEKRSVLGVHYLDDTGNPKLLFPLSGIAAVRMLPSADQKGGVTNARSQEEDEDDDCSHLTHLHHPSSTHTNILISVSYDEVTLPLWYASQQAPECLESLSSTVAIRTPLHDPGSNPRLSRPGSGGSGGGWRGADKGLHLSAASAGPLATIGSKGPSLCLSTTSPAGAPSPGASLWRTSLGHFDVSGQVGSSEGRYRVCAC